MKKRSPEVCQHSHGPKDGYPAMMELADGTRVARGDKDWQYWKFAWRLGTWIPILISSNLRHV